MILRARAFMASLPVFGLLVGAIACSSSSSSPAPGDTAPVDAFINSSAQATCAWEFRCCTAAEITTLVGNEFTTAAECQPHAALAAEDQLYLDKLAVRDNRLKVDPAMATACLAEQNGKACNPAPGTPAPTPTPAGQVDPCTKVFVGATPVGSQCIYANECVAGAHCVGDQAAAGNGVCVPYQEANQVCNDSSDCDPTVQGLYCAQKDFTCHLPGEAGDACAYTITSAGADPTLPLLLECDTTGNLYCDPVSSTCKTLPVAGQPCLSPLPPGVASACDPDPSLNLVCSTQRTGGTCTPPGRAGSDCTTIACDTGLYCARTGTTNVCTTLPTVGQSCADSGGQCATPYYCDENNNFVCAQPASLGQDCSEVTCNTGLYCDRDAVPNTCQAQLATGSPCTESDQCISLECGGTEPFTCQAAQVAVMCSGN